MTFEELQNANKEIKTTDVKGKDYAEVNQRIKAFRKLFPEGKITTEIISNENGVCIIRAIVTDEKGTVLGTGHAYEKEGSTFINKTSYIENCETSAVGRALGMVGIGIDVSVASYEEVANAVKQQETNGNKPQNDSKSEEEFNKKAKETSKQKISEVKVKSMISRCEEDSIDTAKLLSLYKVDSFEKLSEKQLANMNENWEKIKANYGADRKN